MALSIRRVRSPAELREAFEVIGAQFAPPIDGGDLETGQAVETKRETG